MSKPSGKMKDRMKGLELTTHLYFYRFEVILNTVNIMKTSEENTDDLFMLQKVFPDYSEEELKQADKILEQYIALTIRIYDRICSDPESYSQFKDLTKNHSQL